MGQSLQCIADTTQSTFDIWYCLGDSHDSASPPYMVGNRWKTENANHKSKMNIIELLLLWDKENEDLNGRRRLRRRFWRILGSANQVKCYIINPTSKPPDFYSFLFTGSPWNPGNHGSHLCDRWITFCQPGKAMGPNHRWPILFLIFQTILTVWNWKVESHWRKILIMSRWVGSVNSA